MAPATSLGRSIGAVATTYTQIVGILRRETPDTTVVILGVLPSSTVRPAHRIPDLNGQLRAIAALHDAVYLDLYPLFLDESGAGPRPDDSTRLYPHAQCQLAAHLEPYVARCWR